jgi:hypothetical protein
MRPLLLLGLLAVVAGCASRAPLMREALPPLTTVLPALPEPAPVVIESTAAAPGGAVAEPAPPPPPPPPPPPVYLYTRTDADLRLAYADGLSGLLNAAVAPGQVRRLSPGDAHAWLGVLERANPRAGRFMRASLGPVLAEGALVAYAVGGSNPTSCARFGETLFVGVPEKYQGDGRPYVGLIARDACEGSGNLCLRCTSVGGATVDGARPRVCTPAPCGR